jgi:hypothetical protein
MLDRNQANRTKLKYYGSPSELRELVANISPGGSWVQGYQVTEYYSLAGPKIRCYPNGTVFVQGKDGPAGELFISLQRVILNRALRMSMQDRRRSSR